MQRGFQTIQVILAMTLIIIVVFALATLMNASSKRELKSMKRVTAHLLAQETMETLLADGFLGLVCPKFPMETWIDESKDERLTFDRYVQLNSSFVTPSHMKRTYFKEVRKFRGAEPISVGGSIMSVLSSMTSHEVAVYLKVLIQWLDDPRDTTRFEQQTLIAFAPFGSPHSLDEMQAIFTGALERCTK